MSVEFAVVMAPLLLLSFGFIATTAAMYTKSAMQNNAQMAARMMATGQIKNFASGPIVGANATATTACNPSLANTMVEHYACRDLPNWANYTVTSTQTCGVPSVTVTIVASAFTSAKMGDVNGILSGKTLTTKSVLMKEGTCT